MQANPKQTTSLLRGKVHFHNGSWSPNQDTITQALYCPGSLYEVIRIIQGLPLFVEDHYQRLSHSAAFTGRPLLLTLEALCELIYKLGLANNINEGNIRLAFPPSGTLDVSNLTLSFIPHAYPSEQDYLRGITVGKLHAERSHPSVKAFQAVLKQRVTDALSQSSHYEILLVNAKAQITEGSRSNVFFLKDGTYYTAPDDLVLPGITRLHIIDLMRKEGYKLELLAIMDNELEEMDACFLAGTSPMILPIASIENIHYPTRLPGITKLMAAFGSMVSQYIQRAGMVSRNPSL